MKKYKKISYLFQCFTVLSDNVILNYLSALWGKQYHLIYGGIVAQWINNLFRALSKWQRVLSGEVVYQLRLPS